MLRGNGACITSYDGVMTSKAYHKHNPTLTTMWKPPSFLPINSAFETSLTLTDKIRKGGPPRSTTILHLSPEPDFAPCQKSHRPSLSSSFGGCRGLKRPGMACPSAFKSNPTRSKRKRPTPCGKPDGNLERLLFKPLFSWLPHTENNSAEERGDGCQIIGRPCPPFGLIYCTVPENSPLQHLQHQAFASSASAFRRHDSLSSFVLSNPHCLHDFHASSPCWLILEALAYPRAHLISSHPS